MTVRCPGNGASMARPGVPQNVAFDMGLITAGLELISPWLTPFTALVDSFMYQAVNQCTSDPPAMPVFDASDVTNLIGGVLNPNLDVTLTKVNNALLNYAWSKFCICSDGTDPGPPATLAPPAGAANPAIKQSTPCFQGSWQGTIPQNSTNPVISSLMDATQALVPVDGTTATAVDATSSAYTVYGIATGTTSVVFQFQQGATQNACDPANGPYLVLQQLDANRSVLSNDNLLDPRDLKTGTVTVSVRANARYWHIYSWLTAAGGCGPSTGTTNYNSQAFCNGQQPNQLTSCCPPDPAIMLGIQNILQRLANQTVTDTLTRGTTHSNLSGSGTVTLVAECAAVEVNVRAQPPLVVNPGSPDYYFSMGFITSYAVGSPLKGWRLVYTSQIFPLQTYADQMGYTLPPGVIVDLVEMLPAAAVG